MDAERVLDWAAEKLKRGKSVGKSVKSAKGFLIAASTFAMLLSGCASPSETDAESPASLFPAKEAGRMVETTILDMDFFASQAQENTAELDVPPGGPNGTLLRIDVQLNEGAWDTFVLTGLPNACNNVAGTQGLTISGSTNNGGGIASCHSEPGHRSLRWTVRTGAVRGHLTIQAEVPA